MTREQLKPGMVIRFQYELRAYKGKWMQYCGIVIKNERSLYVHCLHNDHVGVFTPNKDGSFGLKHIQLLPWRFV